MWRRGESRGPAAAATGAWPLALALAVVSTMPRGAFSRSRGVLPLPLPQQANLTCHNVPYPFHTVRDESLHGFEVACGPNDEAMLSINGHSYRIDEVSVPGGFVVVFAPPIHQVCYDRAGRPSRDTGSGSMSLARTPFSFSTRNVLVATGCNYTLLANFTDLHAGYSQPSSFRTVCTGGSDAIVDGACTGRACYKADVRMAGAQDFTLSFEREPGKVAAEEEGTCSAAFFLDGEEPVFAGAGGGTQMLLKDALVPTGDRRMVLDWAIGDADCDTQRFSFDPLACNALSMCVNASSGAGYLCKCNEGYSGNPYVADGCLDINECRDIHTNNCLNKSLCINNEGGYTCQCPPTMAGDGYRTGTGCTTGLLPSGLNMCNNREENPCVYSEFCIDGQGAGAASCACPPGMSGDGWKRGSGCQNQKHSPLDIVLGVALALVVTITTASLCYYWSKKKRELGRKRAELFRKNGGLLLQQRFTMIKSESGDSSTKIFSAEELQIATNNYSESRILGRGGHGTVYKGILPDKTVVAIKKSTLFDESQVDQFVNEITILSQIDHPNVVKLLGCCLEIKVPLLVYEFIPNGTLFQHIHNRSAPRPLTWEDCLRIAVETAEALAHLHSTSSVPIIHRDIKSSNILLDENFVAKVSDFGASRLVPFDRTHVTTLIQGTLGYLDPEYFQSSQLTEKSDVYSFGVVLAELLTRQKPISVGGPEESCNLAMHLVIVLKEGRLLQEIESHILAEAGEEQLQAVAQLSVSCLNLKGEERPTMKEVASVLDELKRSYAMKRAIRRKGEATQKNNELEQPLSEARTVSSLFSSEGSAQRSMEAEMLASSCMPR